MLFACAVVAVCAASNAVVSAVAPPPLPPKTYYHVENAESYFQQHIKMYKRKYNAVEYLKRFEIFKKSLMEINALNSMYSQTVFNLTRFADLTTEEKKIYLGFKPGNNTRKAEDKIKMFYGTKSDAPDHWDWRDHGVVTPVKDQGHCGSCYIFSAIGNIEGQYAMKHNQCISLSEEQCLDCLPDNDCDWGGLPIEVMQKLAKKGVGCMKEEDYPYVGKDNQACTEKPDKVIAKVTGGETLHISDEEILKQKLKDIGPLAISLDSSDLGDYIGGILEPTRCESVWYRENHAVLLVGYGEEKGKKYWIIKNSWGTDFGEEGYVRLLRGVNACGIGTDRHATAHIA